MLLLHSSWLRSDSGSGRLSNLGRRHDGKSLAVYLNINKSAFLYCTVILQCVITRDVQRAQYLYLYLNKIGNRCNYSIFDFIILLTLWNSNVKVSFLQYTVVVKESSHTRSQTLVSQTTKNCAYHPAKAKPKGSNLPDIDLQLFIHLWHRDRAEQSGGEERDGDGDVISLRYESHLCAIIWHVFVFPPWKESILKVFVRKKYLQEITVLTNTFFKFSSTPTHHSEEVYWKSGLSMF